MPTPRVGLEKLLVLPNKKIADPGHKVPRNQFFKMGHEIKISNLLSFRENFSFLSPFVKICKKVENRV